MVLFFPGPTQRQERKTKQTNGKSLGWSGGRVPSRPFGGLMAGDKPGPAFLTRAHLPPEKGTCIRGQLRCVSHAGPPAVRKDVLSFKARGGNLSMSRTNAFLAYFAFPPVPSFCPKRRVSMAALGVCLFRFRPAPCLRFCRGQSLL